MKHFVMIVLALSVSFAVSLPAQTQETKVKIDTTGPIPIVKVSHPAFEQMCENFARKIGAEAGTEKIRFFPKLMPMSRPELAGTVWVISYKNKEAEILASELPHVLSTLTGEVARDVMQAHCYLVDGMFYSRHDISIVTANLVEAILVSKDIP